MRTYPDELRADLQRIYGIDLDRAMSGEHTPNHIAALVKCLPRDSLIARAVNPDNEWSMESTLLADLSNNLAGLLWGMSDKRKRGGRRPNIGPSWMRVKARTLEARVMSIDELMNELNKPRKVAGDAS